MCSATSTPSWRRSSTCLRATGCTSSVSCDFCDILPFEKDISRSRTMKAIVYTRYGPPDVLELQEVANPEPNEDQVLVKVHAASVNALDYRRFEKLSAMGRLMEERL